LEGTKRFWSKKNFVMEDS